MKATYTVTLAVLAGVVVGIAAVQGLHAQTKPLVYFIAVKELSDPVGYKKEYGPLARKSIKSHGGQILAAGNSTVIAGEPLKGRVIVLAWDNMEQLRGWFNSPDYRKIRKIGEKYARSRYYFSVPGVNK